MDSYNKIVILKNIFESKIKDESITNKELHELIEKMKHINGNDINNIIKLYKTTEDNKLPSMSDLFRISFKSSNAIDECVDKLENRIKKQSTEKLNENIKEEKDNVLEDLNETRKLGKNIPSFVLFYAEWCGHCKALMPEWKKLEEKTDHSKINIVKISCVEKQDECKKIKLVNGYPTILLLDASGKNIEKYENERSLNGFSQFIKEKTGIDI